MLEIDPEFHYHKLVIYKDVKPIAQRKRKMGEERCRAVQQEVAKLMAPQFVREIDKTTSPQGLKLKLLVILEFVKHLF